MAGKRGVLVTIVVLVAVMAAGLLLSTAALRWLGNTTGQAKLQVRRVGERVPEFRLTGLDGRTWQLDDFSGRVVFVNVWATWCAPCRQELPEVQKLWEQVKDRGDVVMVTMNVDEKQEKVAPFMAENHYGFPVLLAHDFVRGTLATVGIPRNWVIGRDGVWRVDEIGYHPGGDWVAQAQTWIDSARTGAAK